MDLPVLLRPFTEDDLPFAESLCDVAGWNQLEDDWRRLMAHDPGGCFVAGQDGGSSAGSATTTTYSEDLAWIGMLLVHPDWRRRGIGTKLLEHCIDYLRRNRGVRCIKLDATPEGREVYLRHGFVDEWGLSRWMRTGGRSPDPAQDEIINDIDPAIKLDLQPDPICSSKLEELDSAAFGVSRMRMLALLAQRSQSVLARAANTSQMVAYGMIRPGRRAAYLGPVVALPEIGSAVVRGIVDHLLGSRSERPVYWDIPDGHTAAVALAKQFGFELQRSFTRMVIGENSLAGNPLQQWAIGGPAIG